MSQPIETLLDTLPSHDIRAIRNLFGASISLQGMRVLRTLLEHVDPLPEPPTTLSFSFTNQATWSALHGLGRIPSAVVVDASGQAIAGSERWPNLNTFIVTFSRPMTGTIYLL